MWFDGAAELYDAARPGYPDEAIADLVERCGLGPQSRILEIGCGTGQATRALAATGAGVDCVEPGGNLAALARRNLAGFPEVTVTVSSFEEAPERPGAYDAVVSATAFHWVDPAIGYPKAARMLRRGGSLALLTNSHAGGGTHTEPAFAAPMRELHDRRAAGIADWVFGSVEEKVAAVHAALEGGADVGALWAATDRRIFEPPPVGHLFEPPVVSVYPWLARYDTAGFVRMLASQSHYLGLEPERRRPLLEEVAALVEGELGGVVTKEYLTVLATARRRESP